MSGGMPVLTVVASRCRRAAGALSLLALGVGCRGETTAPDVGRPGVRVTSDTAVTDTIDAHVSKLVEVEVRDPSGVRAPGVLVRFVRGATAVASPSGLNGIEICRRAETQCDAPVGTLIDTTDATGVARLRVRLGRLGGRAYLRMTVSDYGFTDSVAFVVRTGQPARLITATADTVIAIGDSLDPMLRVTDRAGNLRTEVARLTSSPSVVRADTMTRRLTGTAFGSEWVRFGFNTITDSIRLRVVPAARLAGWVGASQQLALVDITGRNRRVLDTLVTSALGVFPRFDVTRQRLLFSRARSGRNGNADLVTLADTADWNGRREISGASGFSATYALRALADGTLLVVGVRSGEDLIPPFRYGVFRVALDGTITPLGRLPELSAVVGAIDFSPDGRYVAYCAGFINNGRLEVMELASGVVTVLSPNASGSPVWSPTGDRIAYLRATQQPLNVQGELWVTTPDGTTRRQVTTGTFGTGLAWSPTGAYLLGRTIGFDSEVRVVRVSDGVGVGLKFGSGGYDQFDWR
jgi:hypothetical protein